MNRVTIIGRLTREPEVRYSQGENAKAIARFSVAVDRKFKREGEADADFISVIAFGKNGEFVEKYLNKGTKIAISGHIQTGSYTNQEGKKVYTTDVVAEEFEFVESKKEGNSTNESNSSISNGFVNVPEGIEDELPFVAPTR